MIKDIESCADSISISVNKYYTIKIVIKSYTERYFMAQSKKGVRR